MEFLCEIFACSNHLQWRVRVGEEARVKKGKRRRRESVRSQREKRVTCTSTEMTRREKPVGKNTAAQPKPEIGTTQELPNTITCIEVHWEPKVLVNVTNKNKK